LLAARLAPGDSRSQARDSSTGQTVGSQFTINGADHNYQAFKPFPDGSAAYPAAGSNNGSVCIALVTSCSG
jgi:hypothetical protein